MKKLTPSIVLVSALASLTLGCAVERADPAARSNRATYTITVTAAEGSTATAYISDGLMATADGEGAITQPSTQTTTQNPEFAGATDPISTGINAVGKIATAGIGAYTASKTAKAADAPAADNVTTRLEAASDNAACDGPDCNYETGECDGPDCTYAE